MDFASPLFAAGRLFRTGLLASPATAPVPKRAMAQRDHLVQMLYGVAGTGEWEGFLEALLRVTGARSAELRIAADEGEIFTVSRTAGPERLLAMAPGVRLERAGKPHLAAREEGGWRGNLRLWGATPAGASLLATLGGHFAQVLTLCHQAHRQEAQLRQLGQALDQMPCAIFLLDRTLSLVHHNRQAEQFFRAGEIGRSQGKLTLPGWRANQQLQILLTTAAREAAFSRVLPVDGRDGRSFGLLVEAGEDVRVYAAGCHNRGPFARHVATLFQLRPVEAALATLLAGGFSLAEAAAELQLTENTVRTYCKGILRKVGVSRQTDLVRLLLQSVATIGRLAPAA